MKSSLVEPSINQSSAGFSWEFIVALVSASAGGLLVFLGRRYRTLRR